MDMLKTKRFGYFIPLSMNLGIGYAILIGLKVPVFVKTMDDSWSEEHKLN